MGDGNPVVDQVMCDGDAVVYQVMGDGDGDAVVYHVMGDTRKEGLASGVGSFDDTRLGGGIQEMAGDSSVDGLAVANQDLPNLDDSLMAGVDHELGGVSNVDNGPGLVGSMISKKVKSVQKPGTLPNKRLQNKQGNQRWQTSPAAPPGVVGIIFPYILTPIPNLYDHSFPRYGQITFLTFRRPTTLTFDLKF